MQFQLIELDRETQRLVDLCFRTKLILTGAESMKLRPRTSDATFNQHLKSICIKLQLAMYLLKKLSKPFLKENYRTNCFQW